MMKTLIQKYRHVITVVLSLVGITIMAYYDYCDTECSYLKGDIWSIDLKWIGIVYMSVVILFTLFKQMNFVRAMLAAGLGVEVHLYAFQFQNDVYCPFCLAFSVMLILAFLINYEVPSAWHEKRRRMWLYFLGEVDFPMFRIHKLPLLLLSLTGYLFVLLTFSGSVMPTYGQESPGTIPSLGGGTYEVIIFADYFCPPCKRIDTKAEPLLKELVTNNQIKLTFIDVPFNKATPIFAKYYLYAVKSDPRPENVFRIRNLLFEAAQTHNIEKEAELVAYLKKQKVAWKTFNEKPIYPLLSAMIKENAIRNTPTCIIQYPAADKKAFIGDVEIWSALEALKAQVSKGKK
jgi:thiol:disulfide interchange protein DsbA